MTIHDSPFPARSKDLFDFEGKAELVDGRIVSYELLGFLPAKASGRIAFSMEDHCKETGIGTVCGPGLIYAVPRLANGRESFCPDGSYYDGPHPSNPMSWIENPPTVAIEMRRSEDYENPNVESERREKRDDYFEAGTLVVWDVDPVAKTVSCYTADDPTNPLVFRKGELAHAEPALPGWRLKVGYLFA